MADPKDTDVPGGTQGRRPQATAGSDAPATARSAPRRDGDAPAAEAAAPEAGATQPGATQAGGAVRTRDAQYLIAPRTFAGGIRPFSADALETQLSNLPGVDVLRKIEPKTLGAFSLGAPPAAGPGPGTVFVARMAPERGQELQTAARQHGQVIVERDMLLNHHALLPLDAGAAAAAALPGAFSGAEVDLTFRVTGANGQPLPRCSITVTGRNFPGQGITGPDGRATISLYGETLGSIVSLYVKPFADHWERFIDRPHLDMTGGENLVELQPLSALLPGFPQRQVLGWGQELMGLGQVPAHLDGQGVRIAIIDSGCDNTHPLLRHITQGVNLVDPANPNGWTNDEISHGTHCAGVIAARSGDNSGIRGFAPGAEVISLKVFPGGRFSSLIDALDLCIERQVDVVNCSLGSSEVSEIVQTKLEEARQHGIAVVVAAGNTGGPVQFPAILPTVLSVSAIGLQKRYPADSRHAQAEMPALLSVNGAFPARFSCFGPQVRVSGPGVAIVSTVPGGGYAAWDGTSMAAPHLTGLAALVLAHHPLFQGQLRARSAQRVDALFQTIMAAGVPMVADPQRGGTGLPTAVTALGGATEAAAPVAAAQAALPLGQALGSLAGVPFGALLGGLFGGFPQFGGQPAAPQNGYGYGAAGGMPPPDMQQVLAQLRQLGLMV